LNLEESPLWVRYAGDIFFLLVFLVVLLFFKPDPSEEDGSEDDDEGPNPLEAMLMTENHSEDTEEKSIQSNPIAEGADENKTDQPEKKIPG